ncbi:hypothetical protein FB451DRAFT_1558325 [Mycena latifolia]|nr:hypothetical protein FB451DRAFT_1558325 [Mycena latifolia]
MPARQHPFQRILASSLKDPMHEDSCCIFGILCAIPRVTKPAWSDSDFQQHAFLRLGIHFMCDAASEEQHVSLRQRLLICRCNLHDPHILELHRHLREKSAEKCLDLTLLCLCGHISSALADLTTGKLRKPKGNVRPESQPWPSTVADILPNDQSVSEVLDALLRWAVEPGHGQAVFSLISALARFWEPFIVQLLRTPAAFSLAMQHLQHAADTFPGGPVVRTDVWAMNVNTCALFFNMTYRFASRDVMPIVLPLLDQMNAIGARMEPILDSVEGLDEPRYWFKHVRRLSSPNLDPKTLTSGNIIVEGFGEEPLDPCQEIYFSVFTTIWEKAAWKDEPIVPHKPLCGHICELRAGLEMTDATAWDELVLDSRIGRSPVRMLEICSPYRWDIDQNILSAVLVGLSLLTREKAKHVQSNAAFEFSEEVE